MQIGKLIHIGGGNSWVNIFFVRMKFVSKFLLLHMADDKWQVACGRWHSVGGRGRWPIYLGAVSKAGIRCPHQLIVGEVKT